MAQAGTEREAGKVEGSRGDQPRLNTCAWLTAAKNTSLPEISSGCAVAAARLHTGSCTVRYLPCAAHGESLSLFVFPAYGRHARAGVIAGNVGSGHGPQAGVSPHCRERIPAAATKPKISISNKKCCPMKKTCRARHAGRPWAQRSGTCERIRLGQSARPDVCGTLLARHAYCLRTRRQTAERYGRHRRLRRLLSRRHAKRCTQSTRDADHRGTRPTRRAVYGGSVLMPTSLAISTPASPSAP